MVPHLTQICAHVSYLNYKYLFNICLTLVSRFTRFSPQVFRNILPMTKCHKCLLSANIWLTYNSFYSALTAKKNQFDSIHFTGGGGSIALLII